MPTFRKAKTVKKITEIPSASVKIEVEEKEEKNPPVVEEVVTPETETPVETKTETEAEKPTEVVEGFEDSKSSSRFSWKKIILTILIVVPIGFLAFGGFLYFSKNLNMNFLKKAEPEKKLVIPETTPTPTPEPLDKKAYTIEVQNGSGIAGEGAKIKSSLEVAGFKVGDVGNADNSDYTDTIITVNEDVPDVYIKALTKVLEERGSVGKIKKFATGETGEVLVILGSDLSDITPTP
jgi:hypothetical protein